MPNNKQSWKNEMKNPDFHKNYKLNTNPAQGRTYIPKENKPTNSNNSSGNSGASMDDYRNTYGNDEDDD